MLCIYEQWFYCVDGLFPLLLFLQDRQEATDSNQEAFVHESPGNVQSFLDAVNTIKPTAIIGKEKNITFYLYAMLKIVIFFRSVVLDMCCKAVENYSHKSCKLKSYGHVIKQK